jgi:DNA (cytosine-5)-methyltransferase 1
LKTVRIIDLYAGIGGLRLGFQQAFGEQAKFVFENEINESACKTYEANFGVNPHGDITKIDPKEIPDFDIMLAGFPCQAFSIAGFRRGFDDIRGTHFFHIAEIIREKKPAAFLLENVKHFKSHDKGRTYSTVERMLKDELGYTFYSHIINAKDFGVPQNRERVFMVGFRDPINFEFSKPQTKEITVGNILEENVDGEYFLTQKYLDGLKNHRLRHESKGNGFGFIILKRNQIANTLVLGGMGLERNLIVDKKSLKKCKRVDANDEAVRRLTPRECFRLQGFPDDFKIPVARTRAYSLIANSVAVPVITELALAIKKSLTEKKTISCSIDDFKLESARGVYRKVFIFTAMAHVVNDKSTK